MSCKWISVTPETMPDMDARVLTYAPGRYCPIDIHYLRHLSGLDWWMGGQNFVVAEGDITHWQPLPEDPVLTPLEFRRQYLGRFPEAE